GQRRTPTPPRPTHKHPGKPPNTSDPPPPPPPPPARARHPAEGNPADDGAEQRRGDERSRLRLRQSEVGRDRAQHEAEDEQIKTVSRIADRRAQDRVAARAPRLGIRRAAVQLWRESADGHRLCPC